jgi:hypothetical protein
MLISMFIHMRTRDLIRMRTPNLIGVPMYIFRCMLLFCLSRMRITMLIHVRARHLTGVLVPRVRGGAIMTHHKLPGHGMGVMVVTPTPNRCLLGLC